MKKLAFMFIALVAILSVSACRIEKVNNNDEPTKSYTLNLRDFQSIKNYTSCDIHFTQSDTPRHTLSLPRAAATSTPKATITGQKPELSISGSGDSKLKDVTLSDDFQYFVAGSGDIEHRNHTAPPTPPSTSLAVETSTANWLRSAPPNSP